MAPMSWKTRFRLDVSQPSFIGLNFLSSLISCHRPPSVFCSVVSNAVLCLFYFFSEKSPLSSYICQILFLHLTGHPFCEAFLAAIGKCAFLVPPLTLATFYCSYVSQCIFCCNYLCKCACVSVCVCNIYILHFLWTSWWCRSRSHHKPNY